MIIGAERRRPGGGRRRGHDDRLAVECDQRDAAPAGG